ncbi:histone-lysine N-methyltransferase Clr4 [Aspergillus mulundensis]|uniref:Histone-lysine N-methyltransferase n=1 Tax=Aspergillus mulundensis TaxID=1810919 RepID=A0A3D8RRR7_9EURO|nr:Uncharacterized protein DSM5745_06483 [Aspergillus mulundensis]RDW76491.1 Uncharacterized protein DSM5745_06483 [Aspergillus mulundensis]
MLIDLTLDSDSEDHPRPLLKSLNGHQALAQRTLPFSPSTKNSTIPLKRKSDVEDLADTTSESSYKSAVAQPAPQTSVTSFAAFNQDDSYENLVKSFKQRAPGPAPQGGQAPQLGTFPGSRKSSRTGSTPRSGSHSAPYTPSPAPEAIKVVIPSPSAQLKREINSAELISESELNSGTEMTGMSEKYYPTDAHEQRAMNGAYPAARKTNRAVVPLVIGTPGPFLTEKHRRPVIDLLCKNLRKKLSSIRGPTVSVTKGDEKRLAETTSSFEFINEYKIREGVASIGKEFQSGCSCNTICLPDKCQCLAQEEDSDERIIAYKRAPDNDRFMVLRPEFMKRTSMIFECNSLCGCEKKCWNRVIQLGRTIRFEIFYTGTRGFGLRSPDHIRAGQFIDLYLGEVITTEKADQREKIANARNAPSYLFNLDFLIDDDSSYVVDGANYGGATRFINHSCNPNCRMFAVSRTQGDDYLYDLAFFALREIKPGTELTFDYNPKMERVDKPDPNAVPCLCGEPNCRGQLWANERKKAR